MVKSKLEVRFIETNRGTVKEEYNVHVISRPALMFLALSTELTR